MNANPTLPELLGTLSKRGGRINRYYLRGLNKNKKTLVYLNGWIGGRNIREALLKALLPVKPLPQDL